MLPQYNGGDLPSTKRVYYNGTDTLLEGQALCYDTDDTAAPVTGGTLGRNRGAIVTKPATAVLGGFAGIVLTPITGPGWIDILVPKRGDVFKAMCKVSATKNSTVVGITNAGGYNLVSFSDATLNVDMVAIALETLDTSTTAGLTLLKAL